MPDTPADEWMSIDGLRLHYRDWGGAGQPPLVLVHGLASNSHIWDLVAPILSSHFAVLALDQRGHGESDKPDTGYDFATVAEDLHKFVQAVGVDRPVIVGHSWGGDIAVQHVVARPSAARGLCLIDGGIMELSAVPEMTLDRARQQLAPPDFRGLTLDQLEDRVRSHDFGFELTPQVRKIMSAGFEVLEDNTIRAKFGRANHIAVVEAMWDHRPSVLFPKVTCPVLLMPARRAGDDSRTDMARHREAEVSRASRLLPVSKTVWLEDSVHDAPLQRPALVADVIRENVHGGFFEESATDTAMTWRSQAGPPP